MTYFVGIDGGGTKTELLARTAGGETLLRRTARGTNLCAQPQQAVEETLTELMQECRLALGVPAAVCMGAAGMVGARVGDILRTALAKASGCDRVAVYHDAKIALHANFAHGAGLSLTAGTGSICVAQDEGGSLFRVGGWGHLVSDEGSAYDIACRALRAVVKAHDGMGAPTLLTQVLAERMGCADHDSFIDALYRDFAQKTQLASLADVVATCADGGDEVALGILRAAAEALFALCAAVVRQSGLNAFGVCYNGGVLSHNQRVRDALSARLQSAYECTIHQKTERAVYGAVALAQEEITK